MRFHGKWTGPGWTAGQYKDTSELTDEDRKIEAEDSLDEFAKAHDIGLHDHPENAKQLNKEYVKGAWKHGSIKGKLAAVAVALGGPSPAPPLSNSTKKPQMAREGPKARLRKAQRDENLARRGDVRNAHRDQTVQQSRFREIPFPDELRDDHVPDLGDLIPESDNNHGDHEMEGPPGDHDPVEGEAQAFRSSGGGNTVSKETPISNYPSLTYGLQETHTTILPWTGWLSAGGLDKTTPAQLKIRLNAPWDMIDVTTQTTPADATINTTKGFYANTWNSLGRYNNSTTVAFPEQFTSNSTEATERPAWREYWVQLYQHYTVLSCEYEIIVHNPLQLMQTDSHLAMMHDTIYVDDGINLGLPSQMNTDIIIGKDIDTFSDTATSTGNVTPAAYYSQMRAYKNMEWIPVKGGQKQVIRGTYKPGSAKRNIVNDGDVKTWTATGTTLPNLKEYLTLNFWTDPFFAGAGGNNFDNAGLMVGTGTGRKGCCNIEINLRYIVQFKDLKLQARWPNTVTANQNITQTLSDTLVSGNAYQRWA